MFDGVMLLWFDWLTATCARICISSGWQNFLNAHLINEVFSTQINQMRSFSSSVRLAPMPSALSTTSVRSHGGCAAGFADNFFQRLLSSLTRLFP
jgi:hypothetical protein